MLVCKSFLPPLSNAFLVDWNSFSLGALLSKSMLIQRQMPAVSLHNQIGGTVSLKWWLLIKIKVMYKYLRWRRYQWLIHKSHGSDKHIYSDHFTNFILQTSYITLKLFELVIIENMIYSETLWFLSSLCTLQALAQR